MLIGLPSAYGRLNVKLLVGGGDLAGTRVMEFRILGPLEVCADGAPVDLGPPKQRALLALLLLDVDRVVPTDRILEQLWGDEAAGKERALWYTLAAPLGPRTGTLRTPARALCWSPVTTAIPYGRIRPPWTRSDSRPHFATLDHASTVTLPARPSCCAMPLRCGGARRFRTSATTVARAETQRLEELRLEAIEMRVEADLKLGSGPELIGELTTLVDLQPLPRAPRDAADACVVPLRPAGRGPRACQRYRVRIGEELGLEPSPEMCRLEEQILLHDQRLAPLLARSGEPSSTNPFKGLHAFRESDAEDFFGQRSPCRRSHHSSRRRGASRRARRAERIGKVERRSRWGRPRIRKGALLGSDEWLVASMVPGARPFAEFEAALLRTTIDAPSSLDAQLADESLGLLRAAFRVLPAETAVSFSSSTNSRSFSCSSTTKWNACASSRTW